MSYLVENTAIAAVMAVAAWIVARCFRHKPAVGHAAWLLVLIKLVVPPLVFWSLPWSFGTVEPAEPAAAFAPAPVTSGPVSSTPRSVPAVTSALGAREPEVAGWSWTSVLLALWGVGVCAVALMLWRSARRMCAALKTSVPAPAWLIREVDALAEHLGVRPPEVFVVPGLCSPCVWGLWRTTLLWPADRLDDARPAVRSVLAHELAHLKRGDHWIAAFEVAAIAGFFWHPLLWLARSRMRHHAELSADAWAVWAIPSGRRALAGALVETVSREASAVRAVPVLGARPSARRAFEERLLMILNDKVARRLSGWAGFPIAALTVVALSGVTQAQRDRDTSRRLTASQDRDDENWERSFDRRIELGRVRSLSVGTNVGSVKVAVGDVEDATLEVTVKADKEEFDENPIGRDLDDHVAVGRDGRTLSVQGLHEDENGWQVSFVLTVPRGMPTTGDVKVGSLSLIGMTGDIRAHTSVGSVVIEADDVDEVDVDSGTGSVNLSVGSADAITAKSGTGTVKAAIRGDGGDMKLTTGTGSISLELPRNTSADVRAKASLGRISGADDLGLEVEKTMLGASASGRIGQGGDTIELSTGTGSIKLSRGSSQSRERRRRR